VNAVAIVVGLALVAWMVLDSFETLLATGIQRSRWSFSRRYYRTVWGAYRPFCARMKDDLRRERWLSRLGPVSFLGLLGTWAFFEILGWGLVWWGLRGHFVTPLEGFGDAWYYSGVVYFSIGFGDVLPASGGLRLLTVIEGFTGLGTLGLVIGYLPSLYAAYSAREKRLLLLDDLTDARITPVSLVRSHIGPDADLTELNRMFDDWAEWCADVYDSHTSFPMLIWFRSKHRGHSWVTGLGVVTDAAISFAATVPGADRGPAMRMYRQSVRLVNDLAERVGIQPKEDIEFKSRWWSVGYSLMQGTGVEMRDFEDSWGRVRAMRMDFHPYMEAFIDELLAPRGFWGVTSSDHLRESAFGAGLFDDQDDDA
jgi:hypothetical protein